MGDRLVIIVDNTQRGNSDRRPIQRLTMSYFVNKDDNASLCGKLKVSKNLVENKTGYNGSGVAPQKGMWIHISGPNYMIWIVEFYQVMVNSVRTIIVSGMFFRA